MSIDISRRTFDRRKHFSAVLMQQGRVQVDADWNEQGAILRHRTETETVDVVGACGVPLSGGGFGIGIAPGGTDLTISAGRLYAGGLLCELEQPVTYTTQPDYPRPDFAAPAAGSPPFPPLSPPLSPPGSASQLALPDGSYLVFLDAWQRPLTWLDDPRLREVALGGPDTAARLRTVWQVRLLPFGPSSPPSSPPDSPPDCAMPLDAWDALVAPPTGRLNARTRQVPDLENPCELPPGAGYQRLENQLYRIEVHRGAATRAGTRFKWSRDNATVTAAIQGFDADGVTLRVAEIGKDDVLSFAAGQWVELVDEESALQAAPRPLVQIDSVDTGRQRIRLKSAVAPIPPGRRPKLCRWDMAGAMGGPDGLTADGGDWIPLEGGIEVRFAEGSYRTGDYWLIPARTNIGEIEWPPFAVPNTAPEEQPPAGVEHRFCRLAVLTVAGGIPVSVQDCRDRFPSLTDLTSLFYLGGDAQQGRPGETLPVPLQVGVARGEAPVAGARVRFQVTSGGGTVAGGGQVVEVATNEEGVAGVAWRLGSGERPQRMLAELLDGHGRRLHLPIRFNARLGAGGTDGAARVEDVRLADGTRLVNDTEVPLAAIARGIGILCDHPIERDTVRNRPTCFVTVEMPVTPPQQAVVVAFQPLVLAADTDANRETLLWFPREATMAWLRGRLAEMSDLLRVDRVLARLTLKGNFIWSARAGEFFLDGEAFGIRRGADATLPTELRLPSGDGRRGGDFEMWFYLTAERDRVRPLRVTRLTFETERAVGQPPVLSGAGIIVPPLPPTQAVRLKNSELVNLLTVTFDRPIDRRQGIGPAGTPQSVRLEFFPIGAGATALTTQSELTAPDTIRVRLRTPVALRQQGRYRLTVLGNAGGGPVVQAEDDGSVLDGDFDSRPGGDFQLLFEVTD
ncbi:DUF6519 domain-containing protein [Roseomonas sp. GCM10028921]